MKVDCKNHKSWRDENNYILFIWNMYKYVYLYLHFYPYSEMIQVQLCHAWGEAKQECQTECSVGFTIVVTDGTTPVLPNGVMSKLNINEGVR